MASVETPITIVGAGPAGMTCALLLVAARDSEPRRRAT
jgi:thioredoxin reductase